MQLVCIQKLEKKMLKSYFFSAQGTSGLSQFINTKRLYIKLGKERHAVSYHKTTDVFFWGGKNQD